MSPVETALSDVERIAVLTQLERQVGVLMRRSRRVLAERAAIIHPDLPGPAYLMLAFLHAHGPSRASVIAETFDLDKGAVSRNVHALLTLGLITKCSDPEDGRALILSATPDASAQVQEIQTHRLDQLGDKLDGWTAEDLTQFVDAFARYNLLLE